MLGKKKKKDDHEIEDGTTIEKEEKEIRKDYDVFPVELESNVHQQEQRMDIQPVKQSGQAKPLSTHNKFSKFKSQGSGK